MDNRPYLFSFRAWHLDEPKYILVYAEDEEKARVKGAKNLRYNCGDEAKTEDLICCTYF